MPAALWLTGLPCSGKSTIAGLVAEALRAEGSDVRVLDGDELRRTTSADLGYSLEDRAEQARRAAREASRIVESGAIAIVALVSPLRSSRAEAAALLGAAFVEVHVDASLPVCEQRDVKGLYERARSGSLPDFTGISSPYEPPDDPALRLDTAAESPDESARRVVALVS